MYAVHAVYTASYSTSCAGLHARKYGISIVDHEIITINDYIGEAHTLESKQLADEFSGSVSCSSCSSGVVVIS